MTIDHPGPKTPLARQPPPPVPRPRPVLQPVNAQIIERPCAPLPQMLHAYGAEAIRSPGVETEG